MSVLKNRGIGLPSLVVLLALFAVILSGSIDVVAAASLPGSNFEIDDDANLKVDVAGKFDWANVTEVRTTDAPTGRNDDSYAGGSKEDDACPGTTTGSIPNNKSDLLNFGVYVEDGDPGFLHLFWTRVQEPSGTTLMDFELNQSGEDCGNGVNRVRTIGDLLIEYRIEQGGAVASLKVREWSGSAWGPAVDLSAVGAATGTINNSAILADEADGLGALSPRTFGEASLNLDFIFDENSCTSFGSAFLKSRASDSFTSQLKDFIAPQPVNITNCGSVVIRKETTPDGATDSFGFSTTVQTDPANGADFSLVDGGSQTFSNVLFGSGYTVTEDDLPAGWDLDSIDCSASSGVTTNIDGATVTFDIDNENDVLDCTYYNVAQGNIIIDKVTDPSGDPTDFEFDRSWVANGGNDHDLLLADGDAPVDSGPLAAGSYSVSENVSSGWDLTSVSCVNQNSVDQGDGSNLVLDGGETITCTFNNQKDANITVNKVAVGGDGSFPFSASWDGDGFSLSNGQTENSGDLDPGTYSVSETVPVGWSLTSSACTSSNGDTETPGNISLQAGETVDCTFTNTKKGSIAVAKETVPDGDPADFTFSGDIDAVLSDGETSTPVLVDPGTYSASESVPAGWDLTNITCDDGNSSGSGATATFNVAAGEDVTCTFTNTKRSRLDVLKTDDAGNVMEGVTFSLYIDDAPTGGSLGGEDTDTGDDCTTDASGACSFENLVPGSYWVVEDAAPNGYLGADPIAVTLAAGDLDAEAEAVFENERLHKVILLTCHMGTNDLVASDVTLGTDTITSIEAADLVGTDLEGLQAALCGLEGFEDLEHGEVDLTVDVGSVGGVLH